MTDERLIRMLMAERAHTLVERLSVYGIGADTSECLVELLVALLMQAWHEGASDAIDRAIERFAER